MDELALAHFGGVAHLAISQQNQVGLAKKRRS